MIMSLTISVVIPFFRAEFFHETMASVLAQTRLPEEIVVVNDGSAPEDAAQLSRYEDSARIIHQPNRGPGAARNTGVALASGEWIAFLDDDDIWEPDRLRILCEYIAKHPECNVIHNAVRVLGTERISRKSDLTLRDFLLTYPSPAKPSSVMIRKNVMLQSGLMNPALALSEDYDCFLRIAMVHRFHCVDIPLTQRRKHARNISRQFEVKYRVRNRILFLYGDLYPSDIERTLFATRLNAEFLARAWLRFDLRASREIVKLARMHGVSTFRLAAQALRLLAEKKRQG